MPDERLSNWRSAQEVARCSREAALICPKCGAMNRVGCLVIELDDHGGADCLVCSHHFEVKDA